MKVAIGCDHGGLLLKDSVIEEVEACGFEYIDCGTNSTDSCDYPDYAKKVCDLILSKEADLGILICGTGIGMSLAANKYQGIRCALLNDCYSAKMSKEHNNANCMALGARVLGPDLAKMIVNTYLTTDFSNEEKHKRRINKVNSILS